MNNHNADSVENPMTKDTSMWAESLMPSERFYGSLWDEARKRVSVALQQAFNSGVEESAQVAENYKYMSDCNCDRHEVIAKAIRNLKVTKDAQPIEGGE